MAQTPTRNKTNNLLYDLVNDGEEYKYQLVQFSQSQDAGLLDVDIVPLSWVSWDTKKKNCIIKYPSPPYTAKVCEQLQRFVENCESPPDSWLWWDVQIKGGANSYEMAVARLEKLKTSAYAYTTDDNTVGQRKSHVATQNIKSKSTNELFDLSEYDDWAPVCKDFDGLEVSTDSSVSFNELEIKRMSHTKARSNNKKCRKNIKATFRGQNAKRKLPIRDSQKIESRLINSRTDINNESEQLIVEECDFMHAALPSTSAPSSLMRSNEKATNDNSIERQHEPRKTVAPEPTIHMPSISPEAEAVGNKSRKGLSQDTLFLLQVLKGLSVDVRNNTAAINALHDALQSKNLIVAGKLSVEEFDQKNMLQLPFKTMAEDVGFDRKLQKDDEFNKTLVSSLRPLFDRNNHLTKSISTILRKFLTREVISSFTARKKMEIRIMLKSTNFGRHLTNALTGFHTIQDGTPINEDMVLKAAGRAISNSKDCDGRRTHTESTTL